MLLLIANSNIFQHGKQHLPSALSLASELNTEQQQLWTTTQEGQWQGQCNSYVRSVPTWMSVSFTGSRGSNVVAALRLSSLWEMWDMSSPLDPRRIDLWGRNCTDMKLALDRTLNPDSLPIFRSAVTHVQCSQMCYKNCTEPNFKQPYVSMQTPQPCELFLLFHCSAAQMPSPSKQKKMYTVLVNIFSSSQNKVLHFLALVSKTKNSSPSDKSFNYPIVFWK